jgi:hypothetical protein
MPRPKKISELEQEKPEDENMGTSSEALAQEQAETNIKPSNPDSPHIKAAMQVKGEDFTEPYVETYFWVKFQPRSNPSEQEKVQLTVNGECLIIERSVPVPLPQRFIECAERTTYPVYHQEPGQLRKIATYVTTFAHEKIRPATREEYEQYKAEGTRKMKEDLVKDGTMDKREAGL